MNLYKVINQLTEEEFRDLYGTFTANKADKSAAFLKIIRHNQATPDKEFLSSFDITPSAFYVLKSRLNQKVETYLLNRVGDPSLHIMRRVLSVPDLVANNPREIAVAALSKLEKELLKFDYPYGLMIVYKALQQLHTFDEEHLLYRSQYNKQVAFALAIDKASDLVVHFFKSYDAWELSRKKRDLTDMVRTMEKISNFNNLYESHRLYIYKVVVHLYASLFFDIPDEIRCEVEPVEQMFDRAFEIFETYKDDAYYGNLNLLFNFLRFIYYDKKGNREKADLYYEILDYKTEELLSYFHLNVNTTPFLFHKYQYHLRTATLESLKKDVEVYLANVEFGTYRVTYFVNYKRFLALTYFSLGDYRKAARILYDLRTAVNLRKYGHMDLETKFFLALCYVMMEDFDLANQIILSLQRQLRKGSMEHYSHAKILLKILSVALSGKPRTRLKNLRLNIDKWKASNVGEYALLADLDLSLLLTEPEVEESAVNSQS